MSNQPSRSTSEEPAKESDAPEASTSQSKPPARTTPEQLDDNGQDDSSTTPEETTDKKDESVPADTPTDNHTAPSHSEWQAIWAPAQNAYYFHNTRTNETTWTNPLHPQPSAEEAGTGTSHSMASTSNSVYAVQAAAEAAGIDPSLAYLDPSLGQPASAPAGTFTAKFNARTGAFARPDARDPSHLSESERAKRMSQVYFDVGAWEQEVADRKAEEAAEGNGKKRKRPTKKDLERFKEQKKQKKIAKTAWLRT